MVGGWIGGNGGGCTVKACGVIAGGGGSLTRTGGGWIMTSGFDFTKKVPPLTGKDWKPRQRKRSPMSLCGTAALITPSPHCAGRERNKFFSYII